VDTGAYHLSGAGALVGAGKSFAISRRFFASAEAQVTLSWARVPIETGHARTVNAAFHVLFGFGFGL
jgi:stage V sporulation protein SpoVS